MQRPNEEDPQTVKDYRFDGSPANPFGSKNRESGSRRKSLGEDGSQDSVGPRCFRTPVPLKSLLRRVLRPLRARKPHKLRPEGRDRKLGGEQVREFRSTHVSRVCTCTCALLRLSPAPLATPIFSENQYAGVRRGLLPHDTGYYISIISAPDAPEYIACHGVPERVLVPSSESPFTIARASQKVSLICNVQLNQFNKIKFKTCTCLHLKKRLLSEIGETKYTTRNFIIF